MASAQPPVLGVGFLLSQLGVHSSMAFAERIAPLGLTPPQVGLMRAIGEAPGRTQQALAEEFRLPASRMVGLVDDLESAGLVERRRDPNDRRVYRLHLSDVGASRLGEVATIARDSEQALLGALTAAERKSLGELLSRVADAQGLARGVHPGYRLRSKGD
jgi:DNA-binding MarR family transcriptional regulator